MVSFIDSYSKWIRQKIHQFFINKKLKKIFHLFTCILPNYVPHKITKCFWKNSQFEYMMAGFLLSCHNSLRWEICLICHWNIDSWKQKLSFGYVMVQKSNQKILSDSFRIRVYLSDVPNSQNQFLSWDFFAASYSKTALILTCKSLRNLHSTCALIKQFYCNFG